MLHVETVGHGAPALVLLHGLGVNGAVWRKLLDELRDWPGRIVVPDFRGHGRSPHARRYSIGQHAADVAALIEPGEPVHIVGHSMGGQVGLLLASGWFGFPVAHVLGFGLKVTWRDEELAKLKQVAATPVRWFERRAEAAERFLRVAGLVGAVDAGDPVVEAGIVAENGRYRLAADPATVLVAGPKMRTVWAAVEAPARLACGIRDPLVTIAELTAFDPGTIAIEGCGHNPHVEAPATLARLIPRP